MRSPLLAALLLSTALTPGSNKSERFAAELDGVLRPSQLVDVGTAADGVLETVLVDRGERVQLGQLLAELDMSVEEATAELARLRSRQVAAIKAAEIRLQRLEDRLSDHETLFEDGILSSEDLRETRVEKELAEFALIDARENRTIAEFEYRRARSIVDRGRIKSPVSGIVVERFRSAGEIASRTSAEPIVRIAQMDPIIVETFASVAHLGRIRTGMEAEVRVAAPKEIVRMGKVTVVDRMLDAASETFGVRVEIPNPGFRLPTGLRCRVRILP